MVRFKSSKASLMAVVAILLISGVACTPSLVTGHLGRKIMALDSKKDVNKACVSTYNCAGNLVCLAQSDNATNTSSSTCQFCEEKQDCLNYYGSLYDCVRNSALNGYFCAYKNLWPLAWQDYVNPILILIGTSLAAGGGLGGGGIVVPLLVLLSQFTPRQAVALSNVNIFGASIANFIQLSRRRHPSADRPIIYFDFALMCQPLILAGSIIGVSLNSLFPDYLVLILLVVLLAVTIWRSSVKALELHEKEKKEEAKQKAALLTAELEAAKAKEEKEMEEEKEDDMKKEESEIVDESAKDSDEKVKESSKDSDSDSQSSTVGSDEGSSTSSSSKRSSSSSKQSSSSKSKSTKTNSEERKKDSESHKEEEKSDDEKILDDEPEAVDPISIELKEVLEAEKSIPWHKIGILFAILAIVALHSLLVGGRATSIAGIVKCTTVYWIVFISIFPVLIAIAFGIAKYLEKVNNHRKEIKYPFAPGDMKWTLPRSSLIAGVSIVAGLLGSLVGIGGGMVTNPLMLELGVLATVGTATSSFMIIFSATSNVIQFGIAGLLPVDYSILFAILGFISGLIGQFFIEWIVVKYNRKSYVIWTVVAAIGVSAILLIVTGSINVYNSVVFGGNLGFNEFCPK